MFLASKNINTVYITEASISVLASAQASKQASTYLNKCLLFFDRFSNSPFHSFTTFMAWNSHRFENAECLMLKNSDSGLSRLFPNGKIIGDFQIKTNVISIKKC